MGDNRDEDSEIVATAPYIITSLCLDLKSNQSEYYGVKDESPLTQERHLDKSVSKANILK